MGTIYDDDGNRQRALARAQKMAKLFNAGTFGPIMNAIDPLPSPGTFTAACRTAGLADEEIAWLWNYLKNCQKALYGPLKEAAGTGW